LNICAVKRRHPKLIQATYDMKPFWGWYRAVTDAGIDYRKIRTELLDYVICEICGGEYRHLTAHLYKGHEVPVDDYLIDYPDAQFMCEELRSARSFSFRSRTKKKNWIPHWEEIWTREYILDRTEQYYSKGVIPNQRSMLKLDPCLFAAAISRFEGGWNEVLRSISLNPDDICAVRKVVHDKQKLLREIRQRHKDGQVLCCTDMLKKSDTRSFYWLLNKVFGSLENAVEQAGLNFSEIKKARPGKQAAYPNRESIIEAIKERRQHNLPLNSTSVCEKGKHRDYALSLRVPSSVGYFVDELAFSAALSFDDLIARATHLSMSFRNLLKFFVSCLNVCRFSGRTYSERLCP